MLPPLERIQPLVSTVQPAKPAAAQGANSTFGTIFQNAIDNVKQTDNEMAKTEYLLASGQLDNPAELTIAAAKNEIAVSLLIQLRNKSIDSYNEIMRMSI